MADFKIYNIGDYSKTLYINGTILLSINDHNMKVKFTYYTLDDNIYINPDKEDEELCKSFKTDIEASIRNYWVQKCSNELGEIAKDDNTEA